MAVPTRPVLSALFPHLVEKVEGGGGGEGGGGWRRRRVEEEEGEDDGQQTLHLPQ